MSKDARGGAQKAVGGAGSDRRKPGGAKRSGRPGFSPQSSSSTSRPSAATLILVVAARSCSRRLRVWRSVLESSLSSSGLSSCSDAETPTTGDKYLRAEQPRRLPPGPDPPAPRPARPPPSGLTGPAQLRSSRAPPPSRCLLPCGGPRTPPEAARPRSPSPGPAARGAPTPGRTESAAGLEHAPPTTRIRPPAPRRRPLSAPHSPGGSGWCSQASWASPPSLAPLLPPPLPPRSRGVPPLPGGLGLGGCGLVPVGGCHIAETPKAQGRGSP